jgi:hypothetical protein
MRPIAPFVSSLFVLGCHASVSSEARMDAELAARAPADDSGDVDNGDTSAQSPANASAAPDSENGGGDAPSVLLGARHDFTVRDRSGAVSCRCLSALLGPPSSGKLEWQGEMPRTKPETQLVIALIPDEGSCAGAPKDAAGPSYWGYRVEGNDVIVLIEEWKPARPRTLGAIIPKPPVGGQVYLQPVDAHLPYGKPTNDASARCALGNPGPQRAGAPPGNEGAESDMGEE